MVAQATVTSRLLTNAAIKAPATATAIQTTTASTRMTCLADPCCTRPLPRDERTQVKNTPLGVKPDRERLDSVDAARRLAPRGKTRRISFCFKGTPDLMILAKK